MPGHLGLLMCYQLYLAGNFILYSHVPCRLVGLPLLSLVQSLALQLRPSVTDPSSTPALISESRRVWTQASGAGEQTAALQTEYYHLVQRQNVLGGTQNILIP